MGAVFLGPASTADTGCPVPVTPPSSGGVYRLSTPAHLMWVKSGTDVSEATRMSSQYAIDADINMSGCTWSSGIAGASTALTGSLEGGGHSISGLTIGATGPHEHMGLIQDLGSGGIVRDLSVSGSVSLTVTGAGVSAYVGMVVGLVDGGTVANVITSGSVTASGDAMVQVGGVVGSSQNATMEELTSSAAVLATGGPTLVYAGGIVGATSDRLTGMRCTGSVTVTSGGIAHVGGIAGLMYTQTEHADLTADVTLTVQNVADVYVGGVVGTYSYPALTTSSISGTTSGQISVTGATNARAGGIVGSAGALANVVEAHSSIGIDATASVAVWAGGVAGVTRTGTVTGSTATGALTGRSQQASVGGLVGFAGAAVQGSWAAGSVYGWSSGGSGSEVRAGGLIGSGVGAVSEAYATGPVTADGTAALNAVGGLVGSGQPGVSLARTYALGSVTSVRGSAGTSIGGLIGIAASTIAESYAWGAVTVTGTGGTLQANALSGAGGTASGLRTVCRAQGSYVDCDSLQAGLATSGAAMTDISTYANLGWDIAAGCTTTAMWGICPSVNGGTPYLGAFRRPAGAGQVPPSWLRSFARLADESCPDGWGASWAQWPNGSTGGFVCTQVTYWDVALGAWSTRTS